MTAKTATPAAARATWKGHGNPTSITYYGSAAAPGKAVKATVAVDNKMVVVSGTDGEMIDCFGTATKFWATTAAAKAPRKTTVALPVTALGVAVQKVVEAKLEAEAKAKPAAKKAPAKAAARTVSTAGAPAVYAGPAAALGPGGDVMPMTASSYPEVVDGHLICLGACGERKSASRFPFTHNKGTGQGRYLECGACQTVRLAANKERRAAGQEILARPRATVIA